MDPNSRSNFVNQTPLNDANKTDISDKQTLFAVLQFLRKNNFQGTEELLKKESGISDSDVKHDTTTQSVSDVSHALAAYKSDDDPTLYDDHYTDFKAFIESCLDVHKVELAVILYPLFVHMYLELVYNNHQQHAIVFFGKFSGDQEEYYQDDLRKLCTVTKQEHMRGNQLMENFKSSKFVLKMSRDSYTHLKRHLQEKQQNLLLNIIQEHLFIDDLVKNGLEGVEAEERGAVAENQRGVEAEDQRGAVAEDQMGLWPRSNLGQRRNCLKKTKSLMFDGVPRNKRQIDATSGGVAGESAREANKAKVLYGLLKEPDLNIPAEDEEEAGDGEGGDKPKRKRQKRDPLLMKKAKNDPNAPQMSRIPMPELKDIDKLEKINAYREALKRIRIGAEKLPSICFYTLLNSWQGVTCVDVCEDSSLMSTGYADSAIRVWTITTNKLRAVKNFNDLELIDKESDDVLERMMDERSAEDSKLLLGHTGPVYSASFSPDKNYLVSCSEDGTLRLWSLLTWTNLVCYKGHNSPVWDVKFSPHGHYFASAGHDRICRLWTTDHYQPIRIFAGHLSDVDCCEFHPNGNYVATGSSDRAVRLFDMLTGGVVRVMTGHKGPVHCLSFSPCGRYLASSGVDGAVILWDLSNGNLVAHMKGHSDTVYSLCFSRCGSILTSGGLDNTVKLWDVSRIVKEMDTETDIMIPSTLSVNENPNLLLGSYPTKSTPVLSLHFTRKNLLLASGPIKMS